MKSKSGSGDEKWRRGLPWKPIPISLTIAGCFAGLVFITVFIVLWIQFSANRKNTFDLLRRLTTAYTDLFETRLRGLLDPVEEQAEFIAHQIRIGAFDISDRSRLGALLTGAMAATPQISGIYTWDAQLQQYGFERPPGGRIQLRQNDHSADPFIQKAVAEIQKAKDAYWGELVFREGETFINLRQPLHHDGKFIGFLGIGVTISKLSEFTTQSWEVGDRLSEVTAFVLYGRDHVLAHPLLISTHPDQSSDKPAVAISRLGDKVLVNIWKGLPVSSDNLKSSQTKVLRVRADSQEYFVLYRWINDYGQVPWGIGFWIRQQDTMGELQRLRISGVAGIFALLVAVISAMALGRSIAKPIKRVATGAVRIGEMDLTHVEELPPSAIRELNEQASGFNAMLAGLRFFETYVPRSLVKRLIRRERDQGIASEERELTVMFTDIAGYTSLSEGKPASEIADFLNNHFTLLAKCVEAEGGTIDKFIGDALMAFWGAPNEQTDTAPRACRAALAMAKAMEEDSAQRQKDGLPPVRIRIGIHTGPVVVGNIGAPGRINYTIVGDTVNTCQRLESLSGELEWKGAAAILISGATAALSGRGFLHRSGRNLRSQRKKREGGSLSALIYLGGFIPIYFPDNSLFFPVPFFGNFFKALEL